MVAWPLRVRPERDMNSALRGSCSRIAWHFLGLWALVLSTRPRALAAIRVLSRNRDATPPWTLAHYRYRGGTELTTIWRQRSGADSDFVPLLLPISLLLWWFNWLEAERMLATSDGCSRGRNDLGMASEATRSTVLTRLDIALTGASMTKMGVGLMRQGGEERLPSAICPGETESENDGVRERQLCWSPDWRAASVGE
jgi:hypothetical protein